MKTRSRHAVSTSVAAVTAVVLLIVGAGAGYFAGQGAASPTTVTQTRTVTQTAAPTTVTSTLTTTVTASKLPSVIKIGVMQPLTGPLGEIGVKIPRGVELAIKIWNDAGGIAGSKVQMVLEDSPANPDVANTAIRKLVEVEKVQVIIGPATSREVLTVAGFANDRKIVLISPSATSPAISLLGDDFVFRSAPSDAFQAKAHAAVIDFFGYKRVVAMVVADDYGRGLGGALKNERPDKVIEVITHTDGQPDYTAVLQQAKNLNPDAIFWACFVATCHVLWRQAIDLGMQNIQSIGAEGLADTAFLATPTSARYMADSKMIGAKPGVVPGSISVARAKAFTDLYKATYKEDPALFTQEAFDAANLALEAIAFAGEYSGSAIKKALQVVSQSYVGPSGFKAFDKNGDVPGDYTIYRVVRVGTEVKFDLEAGFWTPGGLTVKK